MSVKNEPTLVGRERMISIGYLFCAILVLNVSALVQLILTMALLLLYWALFLFIPVPGWQGEIFSSAD
jgi:predicted acyltransferase